MTAVYSAQPPPPHFVIIAPFYTVITGLDPVIQGTKPDAKS
jgi:hypothetical protein